MASDNSALLPGVQSGCRHGFSKQHVNLFNGLRLLVLKSPQDLCLSLILGGRTISVLKSDIIDLNYRYKKVSKMSLSQF